VDVDQYLSTPDAAPCLLTSAEKKLSNAVSQSIVAVANGTDVGGNVFFDASNDGIGLSPFYEAASLITPEIQSAIDAATAGLADGSIDPCAPNACQP
jgi:basic membrane protein A